MATVTLENLSKSYGTVRAVHQLSLQIDSGEFFTLLGPSGCGKTTILRAIAGFIEPSSGRIHLGDTDVTHLPPERRAVGMVFQNYALFPHMTVFENVAYGLRVRRVADRQVRGRVEHYLATVRLGGYDARKVSELSGGQQQRVALARALAIEPGILLLDEPLSNLDARLRDQMREEIRQIQVELGITTVYVTHDQHEALTMSDRIAVFDTGVCQQVGPPKAIYDAPVNSFVARFIGETNMYPIGARSAGRITLAGTTVELSVASAAEGDIASIRPEDLRISRAREGRPNEFDAIVVAYQFSGSRSVIDVELSGARFRVSSPHVSQLADDFAMGDRVCISIDPLAVRVVPE